LNPGFQPSFSDARRIELELERGKVTGHGRSSDVTILERRDFQGGDAGAEFGKGDWLRKANFNRAAFWEFSTFRSH